VTYSALATELRTYNPTVVITNLTMVSNSFCLTWTSVTGMRYYVQGLTDLTSTNWTTIASNIRATSDLTTYCVSLPSPFSFFRVGVGVPPPSPGPAVGIQSIQRTPGGIKLAWLSVTNAAYEVQWSSTLVNPNWSSFSQPVTSTNGQFIFTDDGTQTGGPVPARFYRLKRVQ